MQSFRDGTSSSLSSSFRSGRDTHIFRAKFFVSLKFLMWIFFSGFDVVVVDSVDVVVVVVVVVVDGVVVLKGDKVTHEVVRLRALAK